jgi:hypothetical protein
VSSTARGRAWRERRRRALAEARRERPVYVPVLEMPWRPDWKDRKDGGGS